MLYRARIPGLKVFSRGKVRDMFQLPNNFLLPNGKQLLLMVTTDRISAFDVVMSRGVPDLGKIRNLISLFWFEELGGVCPTHIYHNNQNVCAGFVKESYRISNDLMGRCALVYWADVFPVECIIRGYLYGSAWDSYKETGSVCGIKLPSGLEEADAIKPPIFTPTTKSQKGHDEPIDFGAMSEMIGEDVAEKLRAFSLELYRRAALLAQGKGILIADTKFKFGKCGEKIILVDELLTPDSSRYWDEGLYHPGGSQPSFDKQPVRDWLKTNGWDRVPPPPLLPDEVIDETQKRYIKIYQRLTGQTWPPNF